MIELTSEDFYEIRKLFRLTQHEFADTIGFGYSGIHRYESGTLPPPVLLNVYRMLNRKPALIWDFFFFAKEELDPADRKTIMNKLLESVPEAVSIIAKQKRSVTRGVIRISTCLIADCTREPQSIGLCPNHYQRYRNMSEYKLRSSKDRLILTPEIIKTLSESIRRGRRQSLMVKDLSVFSGKPCNMYQCEEPQHLTGLCKEHYKMYRNQPYFEKG